MLMHFVYTEAMLLGADFHKPLGDFKYNKPQRETSLYLVAETERFVVTFIVLKRNLLINLK